MGFLDKGLNILRVKPLSTPDLDKSDLSLPG
jgi:hypothetical protein